MDFLNRALVILGILAAMLLVPALLIFPEQAVLVLRYTADVIQANIDWLHRLAPGAQIGMRLILAAVGMVVFVIGILFLIVEVVRIRRNTVKLKDGSGELMLNGVEGLLAYHVDLLPDVLRARPAVQSVRKGVRVSLYVETAPGVNVPQKADQIRVTSRKVLEDQLGLQIQPEIEVVIKPSPYPQKRLTKQLAKVRKEEEPSAEITTGEPPKAP
jgi:uncharacterized alkaline shock family protein YloU